MAPLDWASKSGDATLRERVRTDLLELASIWADASVRASSGDQKIAEQTAALSVLEEAEAACGRSTSLRRHIQAIRRALGRSRRLEDRRRTPPADAWERYDLGRFHLRSGRFANAKDQLNKPRHKRPRKTLVQRLSRDLCLPPRSLRRGGGSLPGLRGPLAREPKCSYNHGLALEALGRFALARSAYTRAISIDPRLSAARLNRGILSFRDGDYAAAMR